MKATNTYEQNYLSLSSGYMWTALIYNASISLSLYSLALFWYCLIDDLRPHRPLAKFLCIKLIIFFSYWQGIVLAILVWLGIIPDVGYYTPDNIATTIQNTLMCIEMLGFAISHWYAFSYKDYTTTEMIGYARLPVYYALRDTFGIVDLICDFKSTFWGEAYGYRQFDSIETLVDHPESAARQAKLLQGLRYSEGGKQKYWLPVKQSPTTKLLSAPVPTYGVSIGPNVNIGPNVVIEAGGSSTPIDSDDDLVINADFDAEDERIYKQAKRLPYGDYNYPAITVQESIEYTPIVERPNGIRPSTLAEEYALMDSDGSTDWDDNADRMV